MVDSSGDPSAVPFPQRDGGGTLALRPEVLVSNEDILDARVAQQDDGRYVVNLLLTEGAGKRMAKATGANIGRRMAILLDGVVFSAPSIKSEVNREVSITPADKSEAETIAGAILP